LTEEPRRRPVIVTGGRGRLGALPVAALRADGVRTVSLGRSVEADPDDVRVDLRDADAVVDIVKSVNPGAIIHLASVLRGDGLLEQNLLIDEAVAAASRQSSTPHIVNMSSAAVYGTDRESALDEGAPLSGTSPYARSKIDGEQVFRRLGAETETRVSTLRLFNVAGPAFPDSLVMKLLTATASAPVRLTAPDRFVRDYIHQSDAIVMIRRALSVLPSRHRVVNVGAGVAVSTRMLLANLAVAEDRVVEVEGAPSWSWADVTRADEVFGTRATAVPTPEWAEPSLADAG
jgi:nucleoside-diphosphate-sugar epimerase